MCYMFTELFTSLHYSSFPDTDDDDLSQSDANGDDDDSSIELDLAPLAITEFIGPSRDPNIWNKEVRIVTAKRFMNRLANCYNPNDMIRPLVWLTLFRKEDDYRIQVQYRRNWHKQVCPWRKPEQIWKTLSWVYKINPGGKPYDARHDPRVVQHDDQYILNCKFNDDRPIYHLL